MPASTVDLSSLNAPQREAVSTLQGPLLVLAGAGSGKTRVITFRICRLIQGGIKPGRILAVTFTNKAAKEMRERTRQLLGRRRRGAATPEISTFHSLCVRILRRHADRLGYPKEFPIYDSGDQDSLARSALRDIRVGHEKLRPGELLHLISGWKSRALRPAAAEAAAESDKELLAARAYERYQGSLRAAGAFDFDDLLLSTEELFEEYPEVRYAEATRFDHLLIDEYQDTNALQYRIVRTLAERHRNLCVVGDDDQSIYGWRGAEVTHILNFSKDWPDAKVVRLEDNYRSRESILTLANTLIAHNKTRHGKVLRAARSGGDPVRFVKYDDETAEATAVVRDVARLINPDQTDRVSPSDIAILFRTNEQPRAFETELRRERVPYVLVGGQSFYDRKEIRDVLAYLKVLHHPNDEVALLRIINTPSRGIGASTLQLLLREAVSLGRPLWGVLDGVGTRDDVPEVTARRIDGFRRLIDGFRAQLRDTKLSETVSQLLATIDYKQEIERNYKNPGDVETRWNAIGELVNAVAAYEERSDAPTLQGFLEETALSGREDQRDGDDDKKKQQRAVSLMTLHSAKGLEFPHVYMVGMEEGLLPHGRSVLEGGIAEERRLGYVGVTRAQDYLTLTLCKSRMKWGKPRPSIPSRFLMEMRGETEKAERAALAAEEQLAQLRPEARPASARAAKKSRGKSRPTSAASRASRASASLSSPAAETTGVEPKPVKRRSARKAAAMRRDSD